jgi:hypothetical protein
MLNDLKVLATEFMHLSRDALHIHIGLAIYFAAVLLFRRGPASPLPWLAVLALELANEALDLFHEVDLSGAIVDIVNTMFWPTVALVVAHIHLHRRRGMPEPAE